MDSGDRILVAAGLTAAVVVGAFVLWGPGGAPKMRKRRGQIAGLQNLGRTCFLNTLLQALAACPLFIDWLKKYAKADSHNSMITTLYTVIEVVNGTHEAARGTPVCPLGVLQALRAAGWVVPADQQDAHELLHVLLSCIEEETIAMSKKPGCLSDALGLGGGRAWSALASPASPPAAGLGGARADSTPPTPSTLAMRPQSAAAGDEPGLVDPEPEEAPPPRRLAKGVSRSFCHLSSVGRRWVPAAPARPAPAPPFRGTLASRLQCTVCGSKSPIRYDKFDSISLSMANAAVGNTGTYSLAGLLRAFTAPEMVKGVRCNKCSPDTPLNTQHIRTVNFGKLPACLCLHIGRVEWAGGALSKRTELVAFPETVAMAPYTQAPPPATDLVSLMSGGRLRAADPEQSESSSRALYRLAAVVVHVGGPRSGHFATYRRGNGFEARRWWYTSDTLVHEVSLSEVLRCAAYMLFYERAPTHATHAHTHGAHTHAPGTPAHAHAQPASLDANTHHI
ncbi:ubiquitin carboxyl-terminal hydrolase 30 homolog [Leguminivora glycinivorella]|uniref:ubiquitin carboxyl-terminal hydrolase 30 homolog n=1 Tax=Leguminivora glycinivorella TaxID=1035111 RepID=UPI00200E3609|nr:ubiquitin carboxyl-terminal hydrolase 30 homolog [Leguminivora glycinivorella]